MTSSPDYRLYLEDKFERIEGSLERIERHLDKQNSSIAHLWEESNKRQIVVEDFRHLEKDYGCMKQDVKDIKCDIEELRIFKKHPTWGIILITVFVVGMALSGYQTIRSITGSNPTHEMMRKMDDIEYRLKEIYGPSRTTRGGNAIKIDSLIKNK